MGSVWKLLQSSKKTILLIIITSLATLISSSILSIWISRVTDLRIPTIGTIRTQGVEAYWDRNLMNKAETYDWGGIWPGASRNVTLYLQSTSNNEVVLSLRAEDWTFWDASSRAVLGPNSSSMYMNLVWNYNNTVIHPEEVLQVTLTLIVDKSYDFITFLINENVKEFSFDMHITASVYG